VSICFKEDVQTLTLGQTIVQGIQNITHSKSVTDHEVHGVTIAEVARRDETQPVMLTSRNKLKSFTDGLKSA
jgi:hypothetical protein